MSHRPFFIHPPKNGGTTLISFFDLNNGKDQFVNFEWERDDGVSESLGGKNLFAQMLSGHSVLNETSFDVAQTHLQHHIGAVGVCENMSEFLLRLFGMSGLQLPFYFKSNRTRGSSKDRNHLSEEARQKFVDDNCLDYEIFQNARQMIDKHADESGHIFSNALKRVKVIQAEINQLENPHIYSSMVFGFDESFLSKVTSVIRRFDLTPINEYLEFARSRQPVLADMLEGFVDGAVRGWPANLSRPEQKVALDMRIGTQVVARGCSGKAGTAPKH